ncbi:QueT transporter family protein [Phocicoccus pinnipedialis]|uniref:Queuosine transporter QueT n=1 Tax=Phocicoccus pinnipedialis TaxID=110845 RepID=A0A6V7RC93_9BACL|nr:QueT transporter family protein [Jeotgalicoccus pinnipedialis]MBP1939455.1 putative membrane protein [Jeotgalicoccus pinnipedialis]CAD2075350.1 Queuosine precursor transporter QueT [Jeotgalicoccus pinnipedialis]
MKMSTRDLTINAILAALYVVFTTINPIGTGAIQLRVSEMLAMVPFFNRQYIPGILVGMFIANMFSSLGPIDVVVGLSISIIAYTISYFVKNVWFNAFQYSVLCAIIVPLMLWQVLGVPYWPTFLAIFISNLIVTFIGTFLLSKFGDRMMLTSSIE